MAEVLYNPQERQAAMHSSDARWILYGGAAGGGKSHALRWDAIDFCIKNPGMQAYLYRRTLPQLRENHILQIRKLPQQIGRYSVSNGWYEFFNGSLLIMRHCEHENDVENAQGQEFHWLGVDEAGQFTPYQLSYLISRVRLGSYQAKSRYLPRIVFSANPGGPGHHYLKAKFIDGRVPEVKFIDDVTDMECVFIPAKMQDNQYLDPGYAAQFGEMPEAIQKMLRDGDWSVVVGAFFECYDDRSYPDGNVIDFEPPAHWMRFKACDWGFNSPFAIGWYAVADGEPVNGIDIEENTLVKYREWYGWDGTTKKGNGQRLSAIAVAAGIKEREKGETVSYGVADPAMWRTDSGPSPAEMMSRAGVHWNRADRQREPGWQEMYSRIRDKRLLIHRRCEHTRRTIPTVMRSERNTEDVDKGGEDHIADAVRYACMSRPWVIKAPEPEKPLVAPLTFPHIFEQHRRNSGRGFI